MMVWHGQTAPLHAGRYIEREYVWCADRSGNKHQTLCMGWLPRPLTRDISYEDGDGASHTRTVLSVEPEAIYLPSGDHATLVTILVCPV